MTARTSGRHSRPSWMGQPAGWLAVAAAALAWLAGCTTKQIASRGQTEVEQEQLYPEALETFDAAWSIVEKHHYDPNYNGVNWLAVRTELRPRVEVGVSERELRSIIQDMISRLGESHFALIPREIADPVNNQAAASDDLPSDHDTGATAPTPTGAGEEAAATLADGSESKSSARGELAMRWMMLGEQVVVSHVAPHSDLWSKGVRPGWIITDIDDVDLQELADDLFTELDSRLAGAHLNEVLTEASRGDVGSEVEVTFLDLHDEAQTLTLERGASTGQVVRIGSLPPFTTRFESEELTRDSLRVGVIRFNLWVAQMARPIHEAMDRFREFDGIVIDLRGNPGGVGAMSMGVAGHFFNERTPLGTMKMRDTTLEFFANPRRTTAAGELTRPYEGPLVLLTDGRTASTSEIFAGGVQANDRAEIIGQPTMGAALPARMDMLPNGDILLNAFADFVDANGVRLEGRGVIPDQLVLTTRYDLIAGHDPVMEAALTWIEQQHAEQDEKATAGFSEDGMNE